MIMYFKHPSTGKTCRANFSVDEISSFCGGRLFRTLSLDYIEPPAGTAHKVFDTFLDVVIHTVEEFNLGSTHIHDCEDGYWDIYLFNRLPESMELVTEFRKNTFLLTPYYLNGNSGNMVRSLTIISQNK